MPRNVCSEIDKEISDNIRSCRLAKRMTQMQLASALGVTFQQFQKYERGQNRVSASRLFGIAVALGVPVEIFFPVSSSPLEDADPACRDLVRAFRHIADRDRRRLAIRMVKLFGSQGGE